MKKILIGHDNERRRQRHSGNDEKDYLLWSHSFRLQKRT
jgi:hypothetical protein